jgi:hypothetical protein
VAANADNGHILVVDQTNHRIDEFNALGQFINAWGWGVDTGAAELQVCTSTSTCQDGIAGSGAGQFSEIALGIALDSAGNVYVQDRGFLGNPNVRVEKFSPLGEFISMFGGEVNKTKVEEGTASEEEENLCPFDLGDKCKAGIIGAGQGQFGEWAIGSFIAIDRNATATDADDRVYVGDVGRIQIFDTDGHYQGEIGLPGVSVQGLAVDKAGNIYYIDSGHPGVHKISPDGTPLAPESFELKDSEGNPVAPTAVAVDVVGNVYAFGPPSCCGNQNNLNPLTEFNPEGKVIAEFGKGEFNGSTGLTTNLCAGSDAPGNLYVTNASESEAFLRAYGTDPIGCFKARTLPATNAEEQTATLNGTVNPKGEAVTECKFEYSTTATSYDHSAGCVPSAAGIGTGSEPVAVKADISGLTKGTVYHFRLIAKIGGETETGADGEFKTKGPPVISEEHVVSASGSEAVLKALVNPEGFESVYHFEYTTQAAFEAHGFEGAQSTAEIVAGEDRSNHTAIAELGGLVPGTAYRWRVVAKNKSGESASEEHPLFTYLPFLAETGCPNQAFRSGPSAFLSDCRAYEMVSPLDKNGGDITREIDSVLPGNYVQAAIDGNGITYTALAAFGNPPNAFNFNQYLARRQERGQPEEGWSSQGIHTPVAGQRAQPAENFGLSRDFMAFTPDLCSAWLIDHQTPPPTAEGQEGFPNLYRRENCGGAGGFEALVPASVPLPESTPLSYVDHDSVQGYSADESEATFTAEAKLTPEAAEDNGAQLYGRSGGTLHLISVLPGGNAAPGSSVAGSGPAYSLDNAVSEDGSLVYWTGGGEIFVRRHPEQGIVEGECSEAAVACTLPVSKGEGFFWTAATDGSKALYSKSEDLFEFDLSKAEAEESPQTLIAHHVKGVAGASADLSRIYFVSTDALNEEEDGEEAGGPNLYLAEEGTFSFIRTLVPGDVGAKEPGADVIAYSAVEQMSYLRATRVSADGRRIAFDSRAPLTGYDNTGPDGRPAVEVFAYEAGGAVECVSCNPSGARPRVAELRRPYAPPGTQLPKPLVPAAAWIPTWEHALHASNVLSADGKRLFFNSNDALLPRDANGAPDVYEWEAAGAGACNTKSASFFAQNGGCIYLISSGESPQESEFWEASPDGRDVFFTTSSSLLPQDPGSVDLYDARVDGGFPQPLVKAPCEGEACQSPPPPPQLPTPASHSYSGLGNPHPRKPRCPKGKHKAGCAPKKGHKHKKSQKRRAGAKGRAGR